MYLANLHFLTHLQSHAAVALLMVANMANMQSTHKFSRPFLLKGKIKYAVYRKIPGTRKTVYCKNHNSIEQCCKALKKRFPDQASQFTPRKLLLVKPTLARRGRNADIAKQKRPVPRIEKVQYLGVTRSIQAKGKIVWKVQNKYNTDQWRVDTQLEAARAVACSEGLTLSDIKHARARFPMLSKRKQQGIHGPAMALYCNKWLGDCENLNMHAKRPKTWKALERFSGIIPAFLIAKVAADRRDVVASANEVFPPQKSSV